MVKHVVAALFMAVAASASANILYWTVEEPVTDTLSGGTISYTSAKIVNSSDNVISSNDTVLNNYVGDSAVTGDKVGSANFSVADVAAMIDTCDTSSYFYIELFSGDAIVGYSKVKSYQELNTSNFMSTTAFNASWAGKAWNGSSYAAPEPTSGLLVLIGAALLGLKRRKVA